MTDPNSSVTTSEQPSAEAETKTEPITAPPEAASDIPGEPAEPAPSYVKLAMRNMVRKGGKSLFHFALTTAGLIGLFVGLAYLTR